MIKKILTIYLMAFSLVAFPKEVMVGSLNPLVTQSNIKQTICVVGWTKTIRPSTSYTNKIKKQYMKSMSLPGVISDYELDHFIPLSLGGNPTDIENLWMQKWDGDLGARTKDFEERRLNKAVCNGRMTLEEGQKAMVKFVETKIKQQ